MQFESTNDTNIIKLDMLCYGLPDTEKTLNIAKMQHMGFRPLVLSCDPGGLVTLKNFSIKFKRINRPRDAFEFLGEVQKNPSILNPFDLVCIDGVSNLAYMCLKATGESANDRRLDYANANIFLRQIVDSVRRLPQHIYLNAHPGELSDGTIGAAMEGAKDSIKFNGLMNHVVCMRRIPVDGNNQYKLVVQTRSDGKYIARTRDNRCNMFEDNFQDVVSKILSPQ